MRLPEVDALLQNLAHTVQSYPDTMVEYEARIAGTSFFPCGDGLYKGTSTVSPRWPERKIMVLGNDWGTKAACDTIEQHEMNVNMDRPNRSTAGSTCEPRIEPCRLLFYKLLYGCSEKGIGDRRVPGPLRRNVQAAMSTFFGRATYCTKAAFDFKPREMGTGDALWACTSACGVAANDTQLASVGRDWTATQRCPVGHLTRRTDRHLCADTYGSAMAQLFETYLWALR